jgi:ribosome biogenesis GTPase / thiamine phosphate phosphatase
MQSPFAQQRNRVRSGSETNTVRARDGKGRHTTAQRQLIVLDNGVMLIDTPGMRELGNIGVSSGLEESFADIWNLSKNCRFSNCTHTQEVGCALLNAVENGTLHTDQYQSYLKLVKESEYNELSYIERRKKEKKFGQFIKTAMKHLKKK